MSEMTIDEQIEHQDRLMREVWDQGTEGREKLCATIEAILASLRRLKLLEKEARAVADEWANYGIRPMLAPSLFNLRAALDGASP